MIQVINEKCARQLKAYKHCVIKNTDQKYMCQDFLVVFNQCPAKYAKQFTPKHSQD